MATTGRLLFMASAAALGLGASSAVYAADPGLSVSVTMPANLGNVTAANSGNTVFRIEETDGSATVVSGSGLRTGSGSARALVTVSCGSSSSCSSSNVRIRVGPIAAYVNRGRGLTNFTAAMSSATRVSGVLTASNPLDFTIGRVGTNSAKTFWVGMDFPIAGDDSGSASGLSASGFYAYAAFGAATPTTGSNSGYADALVTQGLALTSSGTLNFGRLIRPTSASGTAVIGPDDGQYYNSNIYAMPVSGAPSRVLFTATGEPSRTVSISIPGHFNLVRSGGGTLDVAVSSNAGGSGQLNSSGTYAFGVGGSISVSTSTLTGVYSGSFAVSVAYN
jgi:hypothetical protein